MTSARMRPCNPPRTGPRPFAHYLLTPLIDLPGVVDRLWRPIAEEQLHRRRNGLALTHRLMQLPAVSRRSERLVGPMRGLLIDG
jgi:hypothetical protein